MRITAFYHVWAEGAWEEPLSEYLATLSTSGFEGPLYIGIVGSFAARARVQSAVPRPAEYILAPNGWEQITLDAIRDYALDHEGAVAYAHTKGSYNQNERQREIRAELLDHVISRWRENLTYLADHDAVGWQWTDAKEGYQAFFHGNFWIANCSYLRRLQPCSRLSRFRAEGWLGSGSPKVHDLSPAKVQYDPLRWKPVLDSDVCWS